MKPARIDLFLKHWANKDIDIRGYPGLDPNNKAVEETAREVSQFFTKRAERLLRFVQNFSDVIPQHDAEFSAEPSAEPAPLTDVLLRVQGVRPLFNLPRSKPTWFLLEARQSLRQAWAEPSVAKKRLQLMKIYQAYVLSDTEPKNEAFAEVVLRAIEEARHLKLCQNPEGCPEPFFITKKTSERGCGRRECTDALQRAYKLEWWNRVGKKRLKKRSRSKSRVAKNRKEKKRSRSHVEFTKTRQALRGRRGSTGTDSHTRVMGSRSRRLFKTSRRRATWPRNT